ncbi:FKBP-type peptidyl-prolyl cis-trans isomerase [Actinomadura kijaniata]|uniref:FKBP-type peptidyl-prolyl cis-trans isomerase n=1 Tax=Actinomadura kijaniata TaxID=46161 RepID=UPI00082A0390|nr:FKBP-type peptidyl-prolyl cis-trans isomerase [Actinomadura kijaniata]
MAEDDKPAVKAKLPSAKNIRSPEFKPHGLGGDSRTRGPRPSGLTAAQARKRRMATIAGVVVVALAVAGGAAYYMSLPGPKVEVSGKFNAEPKVVIPKDLVPGKTLKVTTPIKGTGRTIAKGDMVYAKHVFYKWSPGEDDKARTSTNKKVGSTYAPDPNSPLQPLPAGGVGVKGIDKGLVGQTVGSRVVMEIPPADGFGENGAQYELGKNDSLVFVFDILAGVGKDSGPQGAEKKLDDPKLPKVEKSDKPGQAPKVTIPSDQDAPKDLQVKQLVEGTGEAIQKGDQAIVHYQGQLWRNGKKFDSSWDKPDAGGGQGGQPVAFPVGTGGTVPGFDKGLTGQKVGSRVLLVLPPKEGYGDKGQPQAGIKGDDTLVFVVDILGRLPK